ncbi:uncharacterized protein LOC135094079 isoform X3 [Scylla paramamosain]|uniref:uncharacterized protein LOC135094079 isoform X3 n=1 Tax=Scylla paramamosain TaxID=85552 RepID=UPI003083E70E
MQEGLAVMTAGCHRPAGVMVPDQLVHISEMVVVLENSWFAKGSARQAACPHSHQKDHGHEGCQPAGHVPNTAPTCILTSFSINTSHTEK